MGFAVYSVGLICAGMVIGIFIGIVFACAVFFNCRLRTLDREPAEKILEMWRKVKTL